jgi:hypothetical protein
VTSPALSVAAKIIREPRSSALDLCDALDPAAADRDLTPDIEVAGALLEALAGLL